MARQAALPMNPGTSNAEHRMKETENGPLTPALSPEGEREKTGQKLHRVQGFNARTFSGNSLPQERGNGPPSWREIE